MNDRMREEIDNMMQNITFDPAMMQRTRTKSRGHSITHAAKRALALAVAAAILTTGAFALGVSLLQHIRNQMGSFGSQVVPVITANEAQDQGLKVSVVGSMSDSYNTKVYLAIQDMTGDRLDENIKLEMHCKAKEDMPAGIRAGSAYPPRQLSYDKETKTALFELTAPRMDWIAEHNEQRTLELSISSIQPGYHDIYYLDNDTLHFTATGLKDTTLKMDGDIPAPGQYFRKLEGTNGINLSSMGFDENGVFHTLFEIPEGIYFRTRYMDKDGYIFDTKEAASKNGNSETRLSYRDFIDANINANIESDGLPDYLRSTSDMDSIRSLTKDSKYFHYQNTWYIREKLPKEVNVNIAGSYALKPEILGEWNLETTVEVTPEYSLREQVTVFKDSVLTESRLSPLGLYAEYTNAQSFVGAVEITMKDGTVYNFPMLDHTMSASYTSDHKFCWYLDFANPYPTEENVYGLNQPLDITQVDKVTINGVEIPFDR